MDSVTVARLRSVHPILKDRVTRLITQLETEGVTVRVTQGLRTWEEQDALYARGRTAPGPRVTNCPGGRSYHNFGLAVDCVPSLPGNVYNPDWNNTHPTWKRMEALGMGLGLVSGANWRSFPDAPHFQFTGRFPEGEPSEELKQLYNSGGFPAVWALVLSEEP